MRCSAARWPRSSSGHLCENATALAWLARLRPAATRLRAAASKSLPFVATGTGFIVRNGKANANVFWTNSFPVQALTARSRMVHGPAGPLDIALPLTGNLGIEPRSTANGRHIIVDFPSAVSFSGAVITSGTGALSNLAGNNTATVTFDLSGLTNATVVTVKLLNVNDGTNIGDLTVRMGVLLGDATGDRYVNSGDAAVTRNNSGQETNVARARSDVNHDGAINSGDATIVRRYSGTTLV